MSDKNSVTNVLPICELIKGRKIITEEELLLKKYNQQKISTVPVALYYDSSDVNFFCYIVQNVWIFKGVLV